MVIEGNYAELGKVHPDIEKVVRREPNLRFKHESVICVRVVVGLRRYLVDDVKIIGSYEIIHGMHAVCQGVTDKQALTRCQSKKQPIVCGV